VAFVFGLLFFVPFVTQVVGLSVGSYALLRRREPGERVALAWVGTVLALVALPCWFLIFSALGAAVMSRVTPGGGPAVSPAALDDDLAAALTGQLANEMERVYHAAAAYYRDFRKWPDDVSVLIGRSLPAGFTLSGQLEYRPVPRSQRRSYTWILIVSDERRYGLDGQRLAIPHRLTLRLSGKRELLPVPQVDSLLAAQPPEGPAGPSDAADNEGG
jgi:hypothetical protein